jgi:hypothetical protein
VPQQNMCLTNLFTQYRRDRHLRLPVTAESWLSMSSSASRFVMVGTIEERHVFDAEFKRYKYCVWHRTVTSYQGACETTTCHAFQARQGFDSLDPIYYSKPLSKLRTETFYWLLNVYIYTKKTHTHTHIIVKTNIFILYFFVWNLKI